MFKGHWLVFFDELDQEAGQKAGRQGCAEDSTGKLNDRGFPIGDIQAAKNEQESGRLIEHRRMAGNIVDAREDDGPWQV